MRSQQAEPRKTRRHYYRYSDARLVHPPPRLLWPRVAGLRSLSEGVVLPDAVYASDLRQPVAHYVI